MESKVYTFPGLKASRCCKQKGFQRSASLECLPGGADYDGGDEVHQTNMQKKIQITVVGSGYVGLVAAVCFAELGHQVICVDNDESRVTALRSGDTLIHEEYLP